MLMVETWLLFAPHYQNFWLCALRTPLDDWKNSVKRTNSRDGIFAKSSRCDTLW